MSQEFPKRLPDAICSRPHIQYTSIRNEALRDKQLSAKATGLLCILLSNSSGEWTSYMEGLQNCISDGIDSIRSGLRELERAGYLRRHHYVDKATKRRRGSFWAYTDVPHQFEIAENLQSLEEHGLELQSKGRKEPVKNPQVENPHVGYPRLKRTKEKKKKEEFRSDEKQNGKITISMFDEFYAIYPKKTGKVPAKKAWDKICKEPVRNRPTMDRIVTVLQEDMNSRQWKESLAADKQYIPLPSTWLNRRRWEDMTDPGSDLTPTPTKGQLPGAKNLIKKHLGSKVLGEMFYRDCYESAAETFYGEGRSPSEEQDLARALLTLYDQIRQKQNQHFTQEMRETLTEYGPTQLIEAYIYWIERSDWIQHRTLNLLDISHTLFHRFKREYAKEMDNLARDPITGKPGVAE